MEALALHWAVEGAIPDNGANKIGNNEKKLKIMMEKYFV